MQDNDHPDIRPATDWIEELTSRGEGDPDVYGYPGESPKVASQDTYSTLSYTGNSKQCKRRSAYAYQAAESNHKNTKQRRGVGI